MSLNSSERTPQQAIAALLETLKPKHLLLISNSPLPALEAFIQSHPETQYQHAKAGPLKASLAAQRYDLVIIADCLEHLPKRAGLELIGGIRNLNSNRLAVLVDLTAGPWQTTDFYALALQANEHFSRDQQHLTLFTYDLLEYKQVPDWLNAKFWANPENFGKYWW